MMTPTPTARPRPGGPGFVAEVRDLDPRAEASRIEAAIRDQVGPGLRRKGAVVAVSGGVDSAVCVHLAARALGAGRVLGLLLPETDASPRSTELGRLVCEQLGVPFLIEDIGPALDALGCYRRRDEAIRRVFPEIGEGWKSKIVVGGGALHGGALNYFTLKVQPPGGEVLSRRMPVDAYLAVVAATSMKQRTRKLLDYHHAERLHYAVIGTPNRLEYDLGFFVRGGDGLADLKPIAHLYKTQVYRLAEELGVPEEIRSRPPSTDTYSLPQSQEEFYFALPYEQMDLLLHAFRGRIPAEEAAPAVGLTADQVRRVYGDITSKARIARRLHRPALTLRPAQEPIAC